MAERIVDVLEVVEVEVQHRDAAGIALRTQDFVAKRFDEPGFPEYWFRVLGAIMKGYTELVALTRLERKSVVSVMIEIQLLRTKSGMEKPRPPSCSRWRMPLMKW